MSTKAAETSIAQLERDRGSFRLYTIGFVASLVTTITAYLLVVSHIQVTADHIMLAITGLALLQFIVQLFFFLHLGNETKPRWKLLVLVCMIMVILILVFGSLWIMDNLNYRMTPQQVNTYMNDQGGGF
jgi:cytochrome o ubiquinol oxidase operon protein cyoD